MDDTILITTAHDESIALKAIIESGCSKCIMLYQHSFEKVPEASFENIEYRQINGYHVDTLDQIEDALKDVKKAKYYLANVHLDLYLLYYILNKKINPSIWIFDNNQFEKMPKIK
ncbi:hypothetical protein [Methanobacterium sp. ACI-7]|uniref:hypothetical protein n=1 Tax=unclassified Methanobacterium TaxID=2627676 RepID=UPI0039C10CC9